MTLRDEEPRRGKDKITSILSDPENFDAGAPIRDEEAEELSIIPWVVEFRVVGTPDVLRAPLRQTQILGRTDEDRKIFPTIDLAPHKAQDKGVSRLHAKLTARDNRIIVEDIGSSNGTYVNGHRLVRGIPSRVRNGDTLRLGNLVLQLHFVLKPTLNDDTQYDVELSLSAPRVASGERLLVVTDHVDVSQVLEYLGEHSGFDVVCRHTMSEAIAAIDEKPVKAVIVETLLPDGNGTDLLRYVREHLPDVPLMALLNTSGGFSAGQALENGANFTMTKPLAVDELIDALGKLADLMPSA